MSKPGFLGTPFSAVTVSFILLFGGFIVWAFLTDLDYGVHAEGEVASLNPNVAIEHDAIARVVKVHVVEGAMVHKGDPLLTLDNSAALADSVKIESQRLFMRLQIASLLAEQRGSMDLPYPTGVPEVLSPALVKQAYADAREALRQRLLSHQAQLDQFVADIRSAQAQGAQTQAGLDGVEAQLDIVRRQMAGMEPMLAERLIARSQYDDQLFRLEDLKRSKASLQSERDRLAGLVIQTENKRRGYLADREKELKGKLAELLPQLEGVDQLSAAAAVRLRSHTVLAPTDGQVINVKVKTTGEVVNAGMPLMEIVPSKRHYYMDARVSPSEIETVRAGEAAEIRFVTLPSKSTPLVDGRLISISTNTTRDDKTGQNFYIARIEFTGDVAKKIGMEPVLGMPVQALLKGGRRNVMTYLIDPFKVLMMRALREE